MFFLNPCRGCSCTFAIIDIAASHPVLQTSCLKYVVYSVGYEVTFPAPWFLHQIHKYIQMQPLETNSHISGMSDPFRVLEV